jgi:hypothetical protein
MGDRGNVKVTMGKWSAVYLYTHWDGSELPITVQRALAKRWRWDDDTYLARVIFDVMTKGQSGRETGFGIGSYVCDNQHPIIEVSVENQRVSFIEVPSVRHVWSFEEYLELTPKALMVAFGTFDEEEESEAMGE